jgi:nucleoside-diphosphate-sugar epimerase
VRQIADTIRELVAEVPIVHGPERPVDVRIPTISGARAASELGWQPRVPFTEGVGRYLDWLSETSGSPVWETAASTDGTAAAVLRQET